MAGVCSPEAGCRDRCRQAASRGRAAGACWASPAARWTSPPSSAAPPAPRPPSTPPSARSASSPTSCCRTSEAWSLLCNTKIFLSFVQKYLLEFQHYSLPRHLVTREPATTTTQVQGSRHNYWGYKLTIWFTQVAMVAGAHCAPVCQQLEEVSHKSSVAAVAVARGGAGSQGRSQQSSQPLADQLSRDTVSV